MHQAGRLADAVDALVRNERTRPLFVIARIVLDQEQLAGFVDRLAVLEEVDAGVDEGIVVVLMIRRAGRPDGEQVIVRSAARMGYFAEGMRKAVAAVRSGLDLLAGFG